MSEQPLPDHADLIDVTNRSLIRLLHSGDQELARQIEELVALLGGPRETTLAGWNNYLNHGDGSG